MRPFRHPEDIRLHYEVETSLAKRLREAPASRRASLYGEIYDELFRRLGHLPQLERKASLEASRANAENQLKALKPLHLSGKTFLEIGPGDCSVSIAVAAFASKVIAVDASREISTVDGAPSNFTLILGDATTLPLEPHTVDIAYSSDLIEHLHPDDAQPHLESVRRCLADGGKYLCVTPHRFCGPWDISGYFDKEAKGLHLKEYTTRELAQLFLAAGFSKVEVLVGLRGRYRATTPHWSLRVESAIAGIPQRFRKKLATYLRYFPLQYIRIIGHA